MHRREGGMIDASVLNYLARAFDRQRMESVVEAQMSRQDVLAKAAKAGALQGGRTLLVIKTEYVRVVREAAVKMSRHAFDAGGCNGSDVEAVLRTGLIAVRDAIS